MIPLSITEQLGLTNHNRLFYEDRLATLKVAELVRYRTEAESFAKGDSFQLRAQYFGDECIWTYRNDEVAEAFKRAADPDISEVRYFRQDVEIFLDTSTESASE
jgi:hypothetical protein